MHKFKKVTLSIIYEDDQIIVVNKPSGLLTISDGKTLNTLYKLVDEHVKKRSKFNRIFIVHRLDRDTSGIVVFAKNFDVLNLLQKEFENRTVIRKYEVVVSNTFEENSLKARLVNYLFEDKFHNVFISRKKTKIDAITSYSVVKQDLNKNEAVLDIEIETGRRNQIRLQLENIGHPILGDKKFDTSVKKDRLFLNAYHLEFPNLKDKLKRVSFTIKQLFS